MVPSMDKVIGCIISSTAPDCKADLVPTFSRVRRANFTVFTQTRILPAIARGPAAIAVVMARVCVVIRVKHGMGQGVVSSLCPIHASHYGNLAVDHDKFLMVCVPEPDRETWMRVNFDAWMYFTEVVDDVSRVSTVFLHEHVRFWSVPHQYSDFDACFSFRFQQRSQRPCRIFPSSHALPTQSRHFPAEFKPAHQNLALGRLHFPQHGFEGLLPTRQQLDRCARTLGGEALNSRWKFAESPCSHPSALQDIQPHHSV
mmetsp:Transcript_26341/g.47468  ORF Transcript_26341/g.47468 Transcript_26341/m.47468 type:complete len:257 (+) Transcript_26341:157-927(+)